MSAARISLPDRYKVIRHIANGGMAGVWEAHDELLDRAVAVKVLAQHLSEDDRARARFERAEGTLDDGAEAKKAGIRHGSAERSR